MARKSRQEMRWFFSVGRRGFASASSLAILSPMSSPYANHWALDQSVTFLNHGSFGACPRAVLEEQSRLRAEMESEPVRFLARELPDRLLAARVALAEFLSVDAEDLAWVANATTGVNAVLQSWEFKAGDEILTTDHVYNACRNAMVRVAERSGAHVKVVKLPFPLRHEDEVTAAVLGAITHRTRFLLLDHVTSPTGLVLPVANIVPAVEGRGIPVLVDGAHAPGMIELEVARLGASFYTGNCHKWICAPKGAAFLWVRPDLQDRVRPSVISHGANAPTTKLSRFRLEFDWLGTDDPTPYLCVPTAIRTMESLVPGGWPEILVRNRTMALEARNFLAQALRASPPAPDSMIGSLAAVPLPPSPTGPPASAFDTDPLQDQLLFEDHIEVPINAFANGRLVRVACQLYNHLDQYRRLGQVLARRLGVS